MGMGPPEPPQEDDPELELQNPFNAELENEHHSQVVVEGSPKQGKA
jgi:hypothetical protein